MNTTSHTTDTLDAAADQTTDQATLRLARRRVALKMGFLKHALVFALVNLGLWALQSAAGADSDLHVPMWGWALGLGIHGAVVFIKLQTHGLRESMLARELKTLRA